MRGWRLVLLAGLAVILLWGLRTSSPPRPSSELVQSEPMASNLGEEFDPSQCGGIDCRIEWVGDVPKVPKVQLASAKARPPAHVKLDNPNAPKVSKNGEVADAVIMLRGVDLKKSRPWRHEHTTIEIVDNELRVRPALGTGRIGIVRRGATVEMVSREVGEHSIRARGASFFNQMLFVKDQAVTRKMPDEGIVDLNSGTWYYWMRAYLVVSDHPYVGVSGDDGKVVLDQLPAGEYEVICWKANWHIGEIERDREWLSQNGVVFAPPVEKRMRVRVTAGQTSSIAFKLQASDFAPKVIADR